MIEQHLPLRDDCAKSEIATDEVRYELSAACTASARTVRWKRGDRDGRGWEPPARSRGNLFASKMAPLPEARRGESKAVVNNVAPGPLGRTGDGFDAVEVTHGGHFKGFVRMSKERERERVDGSHTVAWHWHNHLFCFHIDLVSLLRPVIGAVYRSPLAAPPPPQPLRLRGMRLRRLQAFLRRIICV